MNLCNFTEERNMRLPKFSNNGIGFVSKTDIADQNNYFIKLAGQSILIRDSNITDSWYSSSVYMIILGSDIKYK